MLGSVIYFPASVQTLSLARILVSILDLPRAIGNFQVNAFDSSTVVVISLACEILLVFPPPVALQGNRGATRLVRGMFASRESDRIYIVISLLTIVFPPISHPVRRVPH